jgi:hypothetical protein
MSALVSWTIMCDSCGEEYRSGDTSASKVRALAKAQGWHYGRWGGDLYAAAGPGTVRDICPDCQKKTTEEEFGDR